MSVPEGGRRRNPYQGLVPFTEADRDYFFGRDRERRMLAGHFLGSRVTLIYGESGVGKTSLLRAGVVTDLREEARRRYQLQERRDFTVAFCNAWRDEPIASLLEAVQEGAKATWGPSSPDVPPARPLRETLRAYTRALEGDMVLVLDQFEEYFFYHPIDGGDSPFMAELAAVVNDLELPVNVVVSLREDALGKLDHLKLRVPRLFDNPFRLEHLTSDGARDTIVRPLEVWNAHERPDPPYTIEPRLVDEILKDLTADTYSDVWRRGLPAAASPATAASIEGPYLQLVMERLWEKARDGGHALRLETYEGLGRAPQIARGHLTEIMAALSESERDVAVHSLKYLVTPSGTKIALTASDVAKWAGLTDDGVEPVLAALSTHEARILRTVDGPRHDPGRRRYEIYHDLLGEAILTWSGEYDRAALWRAQRPWAYIIVLSTGRVHPLVGDVVSMGRSVRWVQHQINLRLRPVSRLHAMITQLLWVIELRSMFGTTVNGEFVSYGEPKELQSGDLIVLGGVAPMQLGVLDYTPADEQAQRVPIPEAPSPPTGWGLLIDGGSRAAIELDADEHYLALGEGDRIVVGSEPRGDAFLRVRRDPEKLFEAVFLSREETLAVEIKPSNDARAKVRTCEPGQRLPPWAGALNKTASYSGVVGVYRDVRFQIVPVIPNIEADPPAS
jgi:hypothetical protein